MRFKERDVNDTASGPLGLASVCGHQALMLDYITFTLAVSHLLSCVLIVYFQFFLQFDLKFSSCCEILTDWWCRTLTIFLRPMWENFSEY